MQTRLARQIYMMTGYVAVTLAVIGMFLPLMPTTCFLILAVWAFSRSAPDKASKILRHPKYGPVINDWLQHRIITRKTKIIITVSVVLMFSISMYCYLDSSTVVYSLFAIMTVLLLFINTRAEKRDSLSTTGNRLTI